MTSRSPRGPSMTVRPSLEGPRRRGILALEILPELLVIGIVVAGLTAIIAPFASSRPRSENAAQARPPGQMLELADSIYALAPLDDGSLIVSSFHSTLARLDASGADHWRVSRTDRPTVKSALTAARGIQGCQNGELLLYDGFEDGEMVTLGQQSGPIANLAVSRDGRFGASSTDGGETRVWNLETRTEVTAMASFEPNPRGEVLALSDDGKLLARIREDVIRVCHVPSGETAAEIPRLQRPGNVLTARFNRDGRILCIGDDQGGMRIWDIAAQLLLWELPASAGPVIAADFTPDGQDLIAGFLEGHVRIYSTREGELKKMFQAHERGTRVVHSLPDGVVVTAGFDGRIRWWDAESATQTASLQCVSPAFLVAPEVH